MKVIMKIVKIRETDGLGNAAVPAGYNTPEFGVGTATLAGVDPSQRLAAQSAAATPNGIDPLNRGFSIGGADDPLAEFEGAADNPAGLAIGGGNPTPPINAPSHPPMATMKEDGFGVNPDGMPVTEDDIFGENENPFGEENDPFAENGQTFESLDAVPAFEDIAEEPALAGLQVDADGVIDPVVIPGDDIVYEQPELGAIPDAALPMEEPVVEIGEDDVDIQIPENIFESDDIPESISVKESFKLPENQKVIVSKGDQIFLLGRVREEFTPKFAESVFTRALKALMESTGNSGHLRVVGKNEKVALVGRSLLVEVAKDWRLPGTSIIFEAHDLLQIVSSKPMAEGEEADKIETAGKGKKENDDAKSKEEAEAEKLKKEAYFAMRRWREADKKRKEADGKVDEDDDEDDIDEDEDEDKKEKKTKKERRKREAAMLERQRTGGWI
jgi:hypothetical protein